MKEYQAMSAIIRREAQRPLKITENGRSISRSTIEVITRVMTHSAMKGNHRAQREFLKLYSNAELEEHRRAFDAERLAAKAAASDNSYYNMTAEELRKDIEKCAEEMGFQFVRKPSDGSEKATPRRVRSRDRRI